jgi:PadR family transcriptional regulator PadR
MENKIKQLRKGILELVILNTLREGRQYGYSLIKAVTADENIAINEGTLYPILSRLSKEGLVNSEWVESSQGPPRKYYALSPKGEETLTALAQEFERLVALVKRVGKKSRPTRSIREPKQKKITVKKESQP